MSNSNFEKLLPSCSGHRALEHRCLPLTPPRELLAAFASSGAFEVGCHTDLTVLEAGWGLLGFREKG